MTLQKDQLMEELQELNSSLEKRVAEATEELRSAHEKMLRNETLSAVGTFASGVAHELATPLSSIISYFQMIKGKGLVSDELQQDCGIIEAELLRCKGILGGMLDFARAPEREKVPTDVNHLIDDLLKLIGYQKEYKGIAVQKRLDAALPPVLSIPGQLRQVFMNIIMNALQSMPGGGALSLSTSSAEEGKSVVIRVTDTGSGIPENELNKIFQPFYTTRQSGTGLGLSISYGIIKAHSGDIEVESTPGKGTTLTITLPVAEQGDDALSAA
jgi:two-component system NtrC family sensor kinase